MSAFPVVRKLVVKLDFGSEHPSVVGRLALAQNRTGDQIYFEYDKSFLAQGFELAPFKLPLQVGLIQLPPHPFEGLAGLFDDSLADGWGRLLQERYWRKRALQMGASAELTPLARLAYVGHLGLGALCYEPDYSEQELDLAQSLDLDLLADQAQQIHSGAANEVVEQLYALNGASQGARPKVLVGIDKEKQQLIQAQQRLPKGYSPWIIKFGSARDGADAGAMEYVYALMAQQAGIIMPPVHLFAARNGAGFFATQRFDRHGKDFAQRYHMQSAAALLHTDFRAPSLDYQQLLSVTAILCKDEREVEKMYRLAVFNVLAHNCDDHAKNFCFLMDAQGHWRLAAGYDLTFSTQLYGQQSTTVLGEGANLGIEILRQLGAQAGLSRALVALIIDQCRASLAHWPELARQYGVSIQTIAHVEQGLRKRGR